MEFKSLISPEKMVRHFFDEKYVIYRTEDDKFYLVNEETYEFIYQGDYFTEIKYEEGKIYFYHIISHNKELYQSIDYIYNTKEHNNSYCLRGKEKV